MNQLSLETSLIQTNLTTITLWNYILFHPPHLGAHISRYSTLTALTLKEPAVKQVVFIAAANQRLTFALASTAASLAWLTAKQVCLQLVLCEWTSS